MEEFVVNIGLNTEELPDLSILERDLQDVPLLLVREGPHFGVEDFNRSHIERRNEVNAILDLLPAFPAEHHGGKNLALYIPNNCTVIKHPCMRAARLLRHAFNTLAPRVLAPAMRKRDRVLSREESLHCMRFAATCTL